MQLTQVQLAQTASSAVRQALSQYIQQTASNPPLAAIIASTVAVQQVQSPTKFEMPAFEGDSPGSWLTWSQKVVYQATACGFEAEVIAVEGEGMSVGADVFDGSNVGLVRLRNAQRRMDGAHVQLQKMPLEFVQRSDAPNDA